MIHEMIRIKYMVFRNSNYKYIHGDLIIHTSTYTVWFLKYKYIQVHAKTQYMCNVWLVFVVTLHNYYLLIPQIHTSIS